MSWRRLITSCVAAVLTAACTNYPTATVKIPESGFVPMVADSIDDVGLGNAVAVDADGLPYISYFGFTQALAEGEIPVSRPIGSPFLPAVQVANLAANGIWNRGAVAQAPAVASPAGITVTYAPATIKSLATLTAANANGTAIAIDGDGNRHVAWASNDGIWYAKSSTTSTVQHVEKLDSTLSLAGPLGRPGIAVDAQGNPWIAYTVNAAGGQDVRVATPSGDGWSVRSVATIPQCGGCPQPRPTSVEITKQGPVVVYEDTGAKAVMAARPVGEPGGRWTSENVASGVTGARLSTAISKDDTVYVAYYADHEVDLAASSASGWSTVKVGDAAPSPSPTASPSPSAAAPASGSASPSAAPIVGTNGNFAETTGVAVDDEGTISVTWYDGATDAVRLARSTDGTSFDPVQTDGSEGGAYPSVATSSDGSRVYLSWYDASTHDLLLGLYGDVGAMALANPSPTPSFVPPIQPGTCKPSGTELALVASGTAFDTNCLAVEAGEAFTINLDNKDPFAHDVSIYPNAQDTTPEDALLYSFADPNPGSTTNTYPVDAISKPGTYFFRCDYHATVMTGTFIVAKSGGK